MGVQTVHYFIYSFSISITFILFVLFNWVKIPSITVAPESVTDLLLTDLQEDSEEMRHSISQAFVEKWLDESCSWQRQRFCSSDDPTQTLRTEIMTCDKQQVLLNMWLMWLRER